MKKISFLLLLLSIILWSCSKDDVQEPDDEKKPDTEKPVVLKNMVTGSSVDAASGAFGLTGGKIKVTTAGSPVNGLELDIPDSSFATAQSFKISYSEIKSHQLGANVNPVSPLIKITTDAGYAQQIMRITIPVNYPAGSIPIGFYYDELTGKLEGIPFESITSNSITLLTRHLMPPSKLKSGIAEKSAQAGSGANILVSSISELALKALPVITSGFKPGVDDWEFVNYGSYIKSGGHCTGQNMTAMWYYFEKTPTEGKLYGRFSDIPNIWQDNAVGYRFCSVIHADLQWDGAVFSLFSKYIDKNQELDRLKLLTIAGTMLATGEPQAIGIYRQTGTKPDGSPQYAGHALICYQVSVNNGKLYISDPNIPAVGQEITFSNNKFQPYMAKLNGDEAPDPYPFVGYNAITSLIPWDKIGKRWDELVNKTIGTVAPNTFPAYTMEIEGTTLKMKEGLALAKDTLTVSVVCPTAEVGYDWNGKRLIGARVFDKDGKNIDKGTDKYISTTILKPGKNKLGYYIHGWRSNSKISNDVYYDKFIDFKWFNVYYMPLTIVPNPLAGEPNTEYKFTARSKGAAPASAKYIWNFGDGSIPLTVINDSTAKHTFKTEGIFKVKVELFDNSNNTKIADTTSTANINIKILISAIVPDSAKVGETVKINGNNFGTNLSVLKIYFGNTQATEITNLSNTSLNVKVPAGASSGNVAVQIGDVKSNEKYFKVISLKPVLNSIKPFSALPQNWIELHGTLPTSDFNATNYNIIVDGKSYPINFSRRGKGFAGFEIPVDIATGKKQISVVYKGEESNKIDYFIGIPIDSIRVVGDQLKCDYHFNIEVQRPDQTTYFEKINSSPYTAKYYPVQWNAYDFSVTYTDGAITSVTKGTISNDGRMITALTIDCTMSFPDNGSHIVFSLKAGENIPLEPFYALNYANFMLQGKPFDAPYYIIKETELEKKFTIKGNYGLSTVIKVVGIAPNGGFNSIIPMQFE